MASDDIKLGFRNPKGKLKTITVRPREGRLANLWLDQLEVLLDNHLQVNDETGEEFDNVYQKNFSILGMPNKYRSADHILDDLDWAIDTINDSESDYDIFHLGAGFGAEKIKIKRPHTNPFGKTTVKGIRVNLGLSSGQETITR